MMAIELVVGQHREIEALVGALAIVEPDRRGYVLRLVADRLEAHMEIEEKLLYPSVRSRRDTRAVAAYMHDHHDIRTTMVALMNARVIYHPQFVDRVTQLATLLREHARDEEEGHLLPLLAMSATEAELDALGAEMLDLYEELRTHQPFRTMIPNARDHLYSRERNPIE